MLEQLFKDLEVTTPREVFIDGVPVIILAWQGSPMRAATGSPTGWLRGNGARRARRRA
jgi:hypothetical protein